MISARACLLIQDYLLALRLCGSLKSNFKELKMGEHSGSLCPLLNRSQNLVSEGDLFLSDVLVNQLG